LKRTGKSKTTGKPLSGRGAKKHNIQEGKFEAGQLLRITTINDCYRINKVTDKAILLEGSDGKWIDNGTFLPIWLPISQLILCGVNSNPANSYAGIHVVEIPDWLANANAKKW